MRHSLSALHFFFYKLLPLGPTKYSIANVSSITFFLTNKSSFESVWNDGAWLTSINYGFSRLSNIMSKPRISKHMLPWWSLGWPDLYKCDTEGWTDMNVLIISDSISSHTNLGSWFYNSIWSLNHSRCLLLPLPYITSFELFLTKFSELLLMA
jgi:hypothetical protein